MSILKLETIHIPSRVVDQIWAIATEMQEYFRAPGEHPKKCWLLHLGNKPAIEVFAMSRQARCNPYGKGCYNSVKNKIAIYPITRCFGLVGIAGTLCHEVAHALDARLEEDAFLFAELKTITDRWEMGRRYSMMPTEVRAEATAIKLIVLPWLAKNNRAALESWLSGGRMPRELIQRGYVRRWVNYGLAEPLLEMASKTMERAIA
jgi:hypothetical protein